MTVADARVAHEFPIVAVLLVTFVAATHAAHDDRRGATSRTDDAVQLLAVACMVYACSTAGAPYGGRVLTCSVVGPPVVCAVLGSAYEMVVGGSGKM